MCAGANSAIWHPHVSAKVCFKMYNAAAPCVFRDGKICRVKDEFYEFLTNQAVHEMKVLYAICRNALALRHACMVRTEP